MMKGQLFVHYYLNTSLKSSINTSLKSSNRSMFMAGFSLKTDF